MYEIEDNPDAKGLAFLINPKSKDCVTYFKTAPYSHSRHSPEQYSMSIILYRGKHHIPLLLQQLTAA